MRFYSEGPNIPDRLLEDRNNGLVVFFCGAGVSVPSGLPNFLQLTWKVLDALPVSTDHSLRKSFKFLDDGTGPVSSDTRLDEIFDTLLEQYDRDQINRAVANLLSTPTTAVVAKEHDIVARLSIGVDRKPQIVTTNFDLLFEHSEAIGDVGIYVPPNFPNLHDSQPVSGLTYLHGRLKNDGTAPNDLILSGEDFGRAYLSEAWATRFLRLLLDKFTVVLLGYQAEDPPVRYFLQGMKSKANRDSIRLYAFDRESSQDVEAKWRRLGVSAIMYTGDGNDHSRLWESLEAWATQADDTDAWQSGVIDKARRGPRALQAHVRGQVAHIVRSNSGAKAFADAAPPAEWLCVFDCEYRLAAEPEKYPVTDGEFSTGSQYALDDDPDGSPHEISEHAIVGQDLIAWCSGDGFPTSEFRLSGRNFRGFGELPPRLLHLSRWIAARSIDPVVAWWAAQQYQLHPLLTSMISSTLDEAVSVPHFGREVWKLIFEGLENKDDRIREKNWRELQRCIEHEGWTPSTLRELQKCTKPFINLDSDIGRVWIKLPQAPWPRIAQGDIARFTVEFPNLGGVPPLSVPNEAVCAVFSLVSRNLIMGLQRFEEVGMRWFHTLTLYPDDSEPRYHHHSSNAKYVLWVAELMSRAAQLAPKYVAAEVSLWPLDNSAILNKLRLFVWNLPEVFTGKQVASNLMAMDQDAFWSIENRREFLILVRDRWSNIPEHEKTLLLDRMLNGRDSFLGEGQKDYFESRDIDILSRIRWLEQQGCTFSKDLHQRITEIQEGLPKWDNDWASDAARSWEGRSGLVG